MRIIARWGLLYLESAKYTKYAAHTLEAQIRSFSVAASPKDKPLGDFSGSSAAAFVKRIDSTLEQLLNGPSGKPP
jgi:hypothetical protein